ncbi:MAG: chloride channel protein [Gemmatimonadota bacterium]|jgi:CIC family chloride channel protein
MIDWLQRARHGDHALMLVLAALIGLLGGLGAVGFRLLIRGVQRVAWGDWTYTLDLVRAHPWWWILVIPVLGALVVGPLTWFFAREARGHGVPEVMEAVALRSGVIRPRLVAIKAVASALTIGTGGSVGREGPIVQIGSAIGSTLGQWLKIGRTQLRTLVGCGAAAGIAATFNAPVAGALFPLEVILGEFGVSEFSPIVISSVLATAVSRYYLGDFPAFVVPPHEMVSIWELGAYVVLGFLASGVALAFTGLVYGLEDRIEALPFPRWALPVVGGVFVGAMGVFLPEVLGVGYEATSAALMGQLGLGLVTLLIVAKLVATSVTLGSGGSGGVFAPSLFLGAMSGSLVGGLAHRWFPAVTAGSGAYALVGMGAVVGATTQAPITSILIIFELTGDYSLILPLMASCIIATVVFSRVRRTSIYTEKLRRRGIDIFRGHELNILRGVRADETMDRDVTRVAEERHLTELLEALPDVRHDAFYVVDGDGRLRGVIPLRDLQGALRYADALGQVVLAGDLTREVRHVAPDERLDTVLRAFARDLPGELPVVDGDGRLVGVVTRRQVLNAYDRELVKRDMAAGIGNSLRDAQASEMVLGEDHLMAEIDAPAELCGRSLQELEVRGRHGVHVLLVRRQEDGRSERVDVVPEPDTVLRPDDRLVLLGSREALRRLRE